MSLSLLDKYEDENELHEWCQIFMMWVHSHFILLHSRCKPSQLCSTILSKQHSPLWMKSPGGGMEHPWCEVNEFPVKLGLGANSYLSLMEGWEITEWWDKPKLCTHDVITKSAIMIQNSYTPTARTYAWLHLSPTHIFTWIFMICVPSFLVVALIFILHSSMIQVLC